MNKKIKIITHSGSFHADDVFAVATIILVLGERQYEIVRSRDMDVIVTGDYIVDVGGEYNVEKNIFDHHQEGGAGERRNNIPYSSFGLVWKEFGERLCNSKKVAKTIDANLISSIDALDNGIETYTSKNNVRPYLFHNMIEVFLPTWKELETGKIDDEVFLEVVQIAVKVLKREIVAAKDNEEGSEIVEEIYKNTKEKNVIIIDGQYAWEEVLMHYSEVLFVVKPDQLEGKEWKVLAVREDPLNSFKSRKDFPESWAGKRGKDLANITGISDALFCHNKRFIVVAGSKEGALKLANLAIELD